MKESGAWRQSGDKNAAVLLARCTGDSVGSVERMLDTAKKLEGLPVLRDAMASGEVSVDQAAAIAAAAVVDPTAERDLLDVSSEDDLASLRKAARSRAAAAEPDPDRRYARLRAKRSFRSWVDEEGMGNALWRTTPDELAELVAAVEPHRAAAFKTARQAGRRDPADVYASDGFLALVRAGRDGPAAADTDT